MWVLFPCEQCDKRNELPLTEERRDGDRGPEGRVPYLVRCQDCETPYRLYVNPDHAEGVSLVLHDEVAALTYVHEDEEVAHRAWEDELARAVKATTRHRTLAGATVDEALLAYPSEGPCRAWAALQRRDSTLVMLIGYELAAVKAVMRRAFGAG